MPTRARLPLLTPGILILALGSGWLQAAQYSGSVRAADQPVPGVMLTAKQGDSKVIAYTDENGRYNMDLAPGAWDISVEMFEFTTSTGKVTIADAPASHEWALEMPKFSMSLFNRNGVKAFEVGRKFAFPQPAW